MFLVLEKFIFDTSEPYNGAMRGTMHEHPANLGTDQKSSLGRFLATRP